MFEYISGSVPLLTKTSSLGKVSIISRKYFSQHRHVAPPALPSTEWKRGWSRLEGLGGRCDGRCFTVAVWGLHHTAAGSSMVGIAALGLGLRYSGSIATTALELVEDLSWSTKVYNALLGL